MGAGSDSAKKVSDFFKTEYPKRVHAAFTHAILVAPGFMEDSLSNFQDKQQRNVFWNNQTFQALQGMNVAPINDPSRVGWRMYNTVDYALYLELANNRKHAAIKPIMELWFSNFFAYAQKILVPGAP